jgi:uncharacterized protein
MVDLIDRLGKLGFLPASSIQPPLKKKVAQIEDLVNGERIANNQGEVILIKRFYPYGSVYGDSLIQPPMDNNEILKFSIKDRTVISTPNLVFIDTETTGLNGGTGTIPFLIGYGYFDKDGITTKQLFLENPMNEMAQLLEFSRELQNFEATVTFNGKSFDLPLIKSRFLMNRMENPLETFSHVDLLHISRKIWKKRLLNRSLKEIESRIINFSRSQDDVPGWLIPQIYFDFLKSGEGSQIKNVAYHNEIDVVSMAVLYQKIQTILLETQALEALDPLDVYSIAKMYFQVGDFERSIMLLEKCLQFNVLSLELQCEILLLMSDIYKKTSQHEKALSNWLICAESGSAQACVEIAKYCEHKVDNVQDAIRYSYMALKLVENSHLPRFEKTREITNINKRIDRLSRRKDHVHEKN